MSLITVFAAIIFILAFWQEMGYAIALGLILLGAFFIWSILTAPKFSATDMQEIVSAANKILDEHRAELQEKKTKLTKIKGYGITDSSKWEKEKHFFLDQVLLPRLNLKQPAIYKQTLLSMIEKSTTS